MGLGSLKMTSSKPTKVGSFRAVQQNPSGMTDESEKSYKLDRRIKELKSLQSVDADRGFIPPSVRYRNILNFGVGLILGCISVPMWNYSKFLYYTVFCVQALILFILINAIDDKMKTEV